MTNEYVPSPLFKTFAFTPVILFKDEAIDDIVAPDEIEIILDDLELSAPNDAAT